MAAITNAPPTPSRDLSLFHTTDPLLANSPVLVFYGQAATIGATSSRVQVHIFTSAGCTSYPRLAVSPNSPFYSAVNNLPREEQGDEVIRGLAFGLKKYFSELSEALKKAWCAGAKALLASALFGDEHVAILATRMAKVENIEDVIGDVTRAFGKQTMSWLDVDVVLPSGSIRDTTSAESSEDPDDARILTERYGKYAELVDHFGEVAFLPTSKLKRAPSKPMAIGRSAYYSQEQQEAVRKEVSELIRTEESYVDRITELHAVPQSLAADLNHACQQKLNSIFPAALGDIVKVNAAFLQSLRAAERAAGLVPSATTFDVSATSVFDPNSESTVGQGIIGLAKCLCEWFPKFKDHYQQYTQSHPQASQLLRDTFRDPESTLAASLQEAGEQKLSSLLIEPIQRLPRYNLYIDSIVKQLPIRHPAIKLFLEARDIITGICDHADSETSPAAVVDRLSKCISAWPAGIELSGRLVTAADYTEWLPPYRSGDDAGQQGILLLFTDGLVTLEKRGSNAASAKSLLADLESNPAGARPPHNRPVTPGDLQFVRRVQLTSVDCLEVFDGQGLVLMSSTGHDQPLQSTSAASMDCYEVLRLGGFYERKAERFVEEICKARVEGGFGETERESAKWEARASDPLADNLSLLSAIFEDSNPEFVRLRSSHSSVRVILDIDRHTHRLRAGQKGIRTVAAVSPLRDGMWRLTIDSIDGTVSPEHIAASEVVNVLRRKLATLAAARFSLANSALSARLLRQNIDILHSIDLRFKQDEEEDAKSTSSRQERSYRPLSPKKLLSSFLTSTGSSAQPTPTVKKDLPSLPSQLPRIPTLNPSPVKPPSREGRPSSKDHPWLKSIVSTRSAEQLDSPLKKFEDTLSSYVLALQARKGNIVGRNLKMRAAADELAVNELYNSLIEDPEMMVLAAQAPVDALFAAFEKFLNVAWKEEIGQVVPFATMQEIQRKAETLFPTDFDDFFQATIRAFPPQNQRAFKAIMKLLAELLDGTGNDGDRGILTCAFAELLVTEGNPHDYIALIDRFVDDPDTYFGEPLDDVQKATDGAMNAHKRARSVNSASITSNTSSLRKKFGFGLSRENSKIEPESKMASVWRSLSKSTRGDASPGNSISKGTLYRSQSTDVDVRASPSRPVSQDGPSIFEDASFVSTSSAHNIPLCTIGEHPSFIPTQPPRKKRRSSLSDLKPLEVTPQKSPAWSPPISRLAPLPLRTNVDKSLPNSPMPSTPSSRGGSGRYGSPTKQPQRTGLPASFRKENSPGAAKVLGLGDVRPKSSDSKADEVVITSRPSSSGLPTLSPRHGSPQKTSSTATVAPLRTGLSERSDAGNIVKKPSPSPEKLLNPSVSATETGSPKKLRIQSSQKLRERLQTEQSNITAAHASLQDELSKISDELTSTPSRMNSIARSRGSIAHPNNNNNTDLAQRVLKLESQLSTLTEDSTTRIASVQSDLATSLSVSEAKCKKLDELYREANGENEALYARFNDELGRILKAVRGGEGVDEIRMKLKEAQEEAAKLKRENAKLKRENAGLRVQLRE